MTDWDSVTWNDDDFESDDPLVRWNAHQAAKGRRQLPDPDLERKRVRELFVWENRDPGDEDDAA